ncbi:MAG: hypothetical protein K8I30_06760 [Anaerolineae bacterium]|nr:hypothetical protein [Anaerolineae bacterium]
MTEDAGFEAVQTKRPNSGGWRVDRTVKISEIITPLLTVTTILLSLYSLSNNLQKDIDLRERERADAIRIAAANALTNLETLQSLLLSVFEELQPVYVDISQRLYKPLSLEEARDELWKSITQTIAETNQAIVDKEIVVGYADLLVDFPGIRSPYLNAIASIAERREMIFTQFLADTEIDVLIVRENYQSALLGGDLRETSAASQTILKEETEQIIDPLRQCILDIISKTDSELLVTPGCE